MQRNSFSDDNDDGRRGLWIRDASGALEPPQARSEPRDWCYWGNPAQPAAKCGPLVEVVRLWFCVIPGGGDRPTRVRVGCRPPGGPDGAFWDTMLASFSSNEAEAYSSGLWPVCAGAHVKDWVSEDDLAHFRTEDLDLSRKDIAEIWAIGVVFAIALPPRSILDMSWKMRYLTGACGYFTIETAPSNLVRHYAKEYSKNDSLAGLGGPGASPGSVHVQSAEPSSTHFEGGRVGEIFHLVLTTRASDGWGRNIDEDDDYVVKALDRFFIVGERGFMKASEAAADWCFPTVNHMGQWWLFEGTRAVREGTVYSVWRPTRFPGLRVIVTPALGDTTLLQPDGQEPRLYARLRDRMLLVATSPDLTDVVCSGWVLMVKRPLYEASSVTECVRLRALRSNVGDEEVPPTLVIGVPQLWTTEASSGRRVRRSRLSALFATWVWLADALSLPYAVALTLSLFFRSLPPAVTVSFVAEVIAEAGTRLSALATVARSGGRPASRINAVVSPLFSVLALTEPAVDGGEMYRRRTPLRLEAASCLISIATVAYTAATGDVSAAGLSAVLGVFLLAMGVRQNVVKEALGVEVGIDHLEVLLLYAGYYTAGVAIQGYYLLITGGAITLPLVAAGVSEGLALIWSVRQAAAVWPGGDSLPGSAHFHD